MARQRIHNSRSGTGAGNAGASWISYSDLMAALLLLFVLILSVSLYQYYTVQETKQAELDAKQVELDEKQSLLDVQQLILLDQQSQLDSQTMQLAQQQVTMDNQSAMIIIMQGDIASKQDELDEKEAQLSASKAELEQALIILGQQQAQLQQNQIALNAAQQALNSQQAAFYAQSRELEAMVGVKTEIISEISTALASRNITASVDPGSGDIVINSRELTFETGKADLTASSKAFLDRFVRAYLEVLMRPEYADYLGSIIIEGHTDQTGRYETNMELSQERALAVLLYIRSMYANDYATLSRLDQILVATGKGYSDPIYYPNSYSVNQDASRRVEFKFSLRDAEMIEEINHILNGR